MKAIKLIILLCLCFVGASASAKEPALLSLYADINLRLTYMEDVALHKARNGQPIEDSVRK